MNKTLSNDMLCKCKEIICERINSSCLNINVDDILNCVHEEIDSNKFNSWFDYNLQTFQNKQNQTSYFKKAFINELNKGTFKVEEITYIPNTQEFINELRLNGMVLLADDTVYLSVLWEELLNTYKMPEDAARELNRNIINYKPEQTFSEYKELIKKSNTIKALNVDWNLIEQKAAKLNMSWDELLNDLESEYD